jgi:hypothetical protein
MQAILSMRPAMQQCALHGRSRGAVREGAQRVVVSRQW